MLLVALTPSFDLKKKNSIALHLKSALITIVINKCVPQPVLHRSYLLYRLEKTDFSPVATLITNPASCLTNQNLDLTTVSI